MTGELNRYAVPVRCTARGIPPTTALVFATSKHEARATAIENERPAVDAAEQGVPMLTMRDDLVVLRNRFELTPAEARLALHLAAGDTLRASARTLGVSYETARTTLKSVFHKTDTCRQVALVIVLIYALLEKQP